MVTAARYAGWRRRSNSARSSLEQGGVDPLEGRRAATHSAGGVGFSSGVARAPGLAAGTPHKRAGPTSVHPSLARTSNAVDQRQLEQHGVAERRGGAPARDVDDLDLRSARLDARTAPAAPAPPPRPRPAVRSGRSGG